MRLDGDHLWSQTFDREMQEVFAIQDEITREIVDALEMQLVGAGDQSVTKHGTYNTDAYQLYLQAQVSLLTNSLEKVSGAASSVAKKPSKSNPTTHWLMLPYRSLIRSAGSMAISHLKKSSLQLFVAIWLQKRQRRSIRI